MRFEEKEDCYLDTETGLEWSKNNLGHMNWHTAMKNLPKGWRLPTIKDLLTLVDYTRYDTATTLPRMMSHYYWSSTTYAYYTVNAWYVSFNRGGGYWDDKAKHYYVRAVKNQSAFLPDGPDFSIP